MIFPLASVTSALFAILLTLSSIFIILLVLVQRGRGGGLAGVLGGMGGSSAFGAKAGDIFTRITAVSALVWICICIAASRLGASGGSRVNVEASPRSTATSTMDEDEVDGAATPASDLADDAAASPADGKDGK